MSKARKLTDEAGHVAAAAERLIRLNEVRLLVGLTNSTIYRLMSEGRFPKQLHPFGNKCARWRASEINSWIAERVGGKAA
jgi:prophage regulatory protein